MQYKVVMEETLQDVLIKVYGDITMLETVLEANREVEFGKFLGEGQVLELPSKVTKAVAREALF